MLPVRDRQELWRRMPESWDLIVIGGGITGAGIMRVASRVGLRCLLVEQRDFAWGSSSRSSKFVHGGLRYLAEGQFSLTHVAVRERERLIAEGPGLVEPMGFLMALYRGERPSQAVYQLVLAVYDLLGRQWTHHRYGTSEFELLAPYIAKTGLAGGFRCRDAVTDDARLVLRVLNEAEAAGGTALNYVSAEALLRSNNGGAVQGVRVRDRLTGQVAEIPARVVVNATGAWADGLRQGLGGRPRLRPLRGSHLVFQSWRVPVAQAVSFVHPIDGRHVTIMPWEGATVFGTTDVDHGGSLEDEPRISAQEVAYLMAGVNRLFPALNLGLDDIISSFSGVRPIIGTHQNDSTKEARDHVVWDEEGLITVTGGKLTTFHRMALDTLAAVRGRLPRMAELGRIPALDHAGGASIPAAGLDEIRRRRLAGRYGAAAAQVLAAGPPDEIELIPGTPTLWAELRWAARTEAVAHLDDLLLRRTRLGLLLPCGAEAILPRVRSLCQAELGWDDDRWQAEVAAYRSLWQAGYGLPDRAEISAEIAAWRPGRSSSKPTAHRARPRRVRIGGRP